MTVKPAKTILLVRPPEKLQPGRNRPIVYFPVGLLQIAAVMKQRGYNIKLIDGILPEEADPASAGVVESVFRRINTR